MTNLTSTFSIPEWEIQNIWNAKLDVYDKEKVQNLKDFLFVLHLANKILEERTMNGFTSEFDDTHTITILPSMRYMIKSVCIWQIHRNLTYTDYETASVSLVSEHFSIGQEEDKTTFEDVYYAKDDTNFGFEYESGSGNTRIEFSYKENNMYLTIESDESRYTHWCKYSGLGSFNVSLNFKDYQIKDNYIYDFNIKQYLEENEKQLNTAVRQYMETLKDWRYDNDIDED